MFQWAMKDEIDIVTHPFKKKKKKKRKSKYDHCTSLTKNHFLHTHVHSSPNTDKNKLKKDPYWC